MVLKASDELRHPEFLNDDYHWRESLYFNFNDPVNKIGAWLYLWVVPNQPKPSGMLVSFYHGAWPDLKINDKASASPGHRIVDGDRWIYCFKKDADHLIDANFDDVELFGMKFKRLEPLKRQHLTFDDGEGNGFDLQASFQMPPYDYADGAHPTPPWMAANRYHRSWSVSGKLRIAGKEYDIATTGDSDHSWGQRHNTEFGKNLFKMWSFQTKDGALSLSVLKQGIDEKDTQIPLGFLTKDGTVSAVTKIDTSASYDAKGVQYGVDLYVEDKLGRSVRAKFAKMHSYLGSGSFETFWGYEGVGDYEVEGVGKVSGLISYFWPTRVTPEALHAGKWK
jgi:hypothetical protein